MKTTAEHLINYVKSSKISLNGSLGAGILKEVSGKISAKKSVELKSEFGNVNMNEVAVNALSDALQVANNKWTKIMMWRYKNMQMTLTIF